MASTLRVHELAKELGVPSKVILEKCRAEGVEVRNHMSAISVGLAESIREWFSVDADVTSVEVSAPVDVTLVRRASAQDDEGATESAAAVEVATETPEEATLPAPEAPEPEEAVSPPPLVAPDVAAAEAPVAPTAPAAPVAPVAPVVPVVTETPAVPAAPAVVSTPEPPAAPAATPAEPLAPAAEAELPTPSAAEEPEAPAAPVTPVAPPAPPVMPAGPQLVPRPAELKGPQVVRIEAPEPDHQRPRPRPRPALGTAARGPAPSTDDAQTAARRGGRGRVGGATGGEEGDAARGRGRSPRRKPGATDVDQRLREWRDQDLIERKERLASVTGHGLRERRAAERRRQQTQGGGAVTSTRREPVTITTPISLKDFSAATGTPFSVLSRKLLEQTGKLWMINQTIDDELAELLAVELDAQIQIEKQKTGLEKLRDEFTDREREHLESRPPVVAMLGHVDHGKTSLLDAIRKTRVASGEAGGITQHIGASRIDQGDWHVTFIDTPGHEAFTAMRARGANLTDVVVLVVAADDGVMPQTIEAIAHAKAAGVTIVVALNKSDLPGIDLNRVYGQLVEHGLTPTEWGGDIDVIQTSATTGMGVEELLTHLSTLSELLDLKADPTVPARGTVIESQMKEGRGVSVQILVREGTLRPGDIIVCGPGAGRIRSLRDDRGHQLKSATPGTPVEVAGLDEMPSSGDDLFVVKDLARAKAIAEEVKQQQREESLTAVGKPRTLEALVRAGDQEIPELNVILKADVQGSVEVLRKSLAEFPDDKARLNILHAAVGAVSEADVQLAKASNAMIIGFHVIAEDHARQLADQLGVEVRTYRVIYEIIGDLHKALAGLLEPEKHEEFRGTAEIRQVFNITGAGTIAGCYVTDGFIRRNHKVRLVRDGRIILDGSDLASLKRFKDDVREVRNGFECGLKIVNYDDLKPGDIVQAFEVVEVAQEL